jgi:hypothetical protein
MRDRAGAIGELRQCQLWVDTVEKLRALGIARNNRSLSGLNEQV